MKTVPAEAATPATPTGYWSSVVPNYGVQTVVPTAAKQTSHDWFRATGYGLRLFRGTVATGYGLRSFRATVVPGYGCGGRSPSSRSLRSCGLTSPTAQYV